MLRLHDCASSGNAYKIRLLLTQLDIPFERIDYDTDRGTTRTPAFLRDTNPNGRVPVLELAAGQSIVSSSSVTATGSSSDPRSTNNRGGERNEPRPC